MSQGIVTVVGSYVTDLMSRTPHMPKVGETVLGGPFKMGPGGKGGNQAVAAARQGSMVYMVSKVGDDEFGTYARSNFAKEHIHTEYVFVDPEESTGAALIAVDDHGDNMIVVALGACGKLTALEVAQASGAIGTSAVVLLQLETSNEAVVRTVAMAKNFGIPVIFNPAPYHEFPREILKDITYITPNETEAFGLTGVQVDDEEDALRAAKIMYEMGVANILITLGKKGCYFYNGGETGRLFSGFEVQSVDSTGAGDAFNGGLAHALASGQKLDDAIIYANAVAALSVTKMGTAPAMPTKEEVDVFLAERK